MTLTFLSVVAAAPFSSEASKVYVRGANFPRSAAVHRPSSDIIVVGTPGNFSVTSVIGTDEVHVIDDGTSVVYPVDVAFLGDTALIIDQASPPAGLGGRGASSSLGPAIAAFNRSSSGTWGFWTRWLIQDLVPPCEEEGTRYGMPETVAVGPGGEVYVGLAYQRMKRCLLHPFDRCCTAAAGSDSVIMQLIHSEGGKLALREVFSGRDFFDFHYNGSTLPSTYHGRAIEVTGAGDILVAGYGDDGGYFGHSAWRWEKRTGKVVNVAGPNFGQGGKSGDGGNASLANLSLPWGITSLPAGRSRAEVVYISESGNSDVRAVEHGIISTVPGLTMDLTNCRKIHRGRSPDTLLLTMEGLGEKMGYVLEFTPSNVSFRDTFIV